MPLTSEFALRIREGAKRGANARRKSCPAGTSSGLWQAASAQLTSRTRCEQEPGHEVEIVESEVRTARVVDPAQRLAPAIYQPETDVSAMTPLPGL
jgi:hypothetical protein